MLGKLEHYEIRGIINKWSETCLKDRQQFVLINGYNSECASIPTGVPQWFVLSPLPFLLYINDLNLATKLCKVHHFGDDTNLWHTQTLTKLKCFYLSPQKTFRLSSQLKLKLNGRRIYETSSVKYLGIEIDQHLNWQNLLFFHEHSRFTGQQGKWKAISSTPFYHFPHFHPLHRHLCIIRAITAESSPLHIASSRTRTRGLWFPRASC